VSAADRAHQVGFAGHVRPGWAGVAGDELNGANIDASARRITVAKPSIDARQAGPGSFHDVGEAVTASGCPRADGP